MSSYKRRIETYYHDLQLSINACRGNIEHNLQMIDIHKEQIKNDRARIRLEMKEVTRVENLLKTVK